MIEEAEKIILGTILAIPEYQERILSDLSPCLFYSDTNRKVYEKIRQIKQDGGQIDILTVVNAFSKPELETVGGAYYISTLTSKVASGAHYQDHIKILKENYIRLNLIKIFSKEISKLTDKMNDVYDSYTVVTNEVEKLFVMPSKNFRDANDIIGARLDQYEEAARNGNTIIGLDTGHSKLNKITNGWQAGDLIILAARPSMGKTAVSLYFAKHPAKNGKTVLYFSLEMPAERLIDRIISTDTNIDSSRLQIGKIEDYEWEQLSIKTASYGDNKLLINDESGLTIEDIMHAALMEASKQDIDMIIIDYIQLIKLSGGGNTTNDKVGHISKTSKEMAKKIGCPVMQLSQLSRQVEQRSGNKIPQMSDLRDSGNIEQDADVIMFLYRPEYYDIQEMADNTPTANLIELIISKNRNGAIGTTEMYKNENWSYIGELPFGECESLIENMPFSIDQGIEPNMGGF